MSPTRLTAIPLLGLVLGAWLLAPPPALACCDDRDQDGYADDRDKCPDRPEDFDGDRDEDGCPDLDSDGDGFEDPVDRCPLDPEDRDGFEDSDGCPDVDNDRDGILDASDRCPNHPEDLDGFQDGDGCPDPDNDGDGLLDTVDRCMNNPETFNSYKDEDGCPDIKPVQRKYELINPTEVRIEIKKRVRFKYRSWALLPKSFRLLNEVATYILDNPTIQVRIEGHTDERGGGKYNKVLSQRRSESVKDYLIQAGVDGKRLLAQGFGESQPRCEGRGRKCRTANRRVEFHIVPAPELPPGAAP